MSPNSDVAGIAAQAAVPMLIVANDARWTVAVANEQAARLLGTGVNALAGQGFFELVQSHAGTSAADRVAAVRDDLQRTLLGRAATPMRSPFADPSPTSATWLCWPLFAADGLVSHLVCQQSRAEIASLPRTAATSISGEEVPALPTNQVPAPQPPYSRRLKKLPPRRILVVDDTHDAATMLGRLLTALGQQVEIAYDGQSALDAARRTKPDLVISDIAMPGMDGYELARQLRSSEAFGDLKLVALTGYGQDRDRRQAFEAGFNRHLVKPITLQCLENLLVEMLGGGASSPLSDS